MNFRHYDTVETTLSSRKRTLLRRAINNLERSIRNNPARYAASHSITSNDTIRTHLRDINSLKGDLNL